MPRVVFTSNLQRHVNCPETQVAAGTVRESWRCLSTQLPPIHCVRFG